MSFRPSSRMISAFSGPFRRIIDKLLRGYFLGRILPKSVKRCGNSGYKFFYACIWADFMQLTPA